ncbi:MAG: glycosyltransferase [Moraxellaceae bacterium]|nr:MAG: glycosyltransferase [Moraxellaceae bacterium]
MLHILNHTRSVANCRNQGQFCSRVNQYINWQSIASKLAYFNTITRLSGKAYSSVVATSTNDGDLFSQIMKDDKLQVIENGVNVEKYANQAAPQLQPMLIYFGRWSANKGLVESLDLFAALSARDPNWKLIIAGREYDHSVSDLQTRINERGLQDRVHLVANPSDEEIRNLLKQASYYLCLSRHEGFGIAPIEGMSAGLTPILSNIPPFRRLIDQSGLGFTLDENSSVDATVDRLLKLHSEGNEAYLERREQAIKFSNQYAWPQVADRYLALYEQLGGGHVR